MKKRGFRFVAGAAFAWMSSGSILLAGCGGRSVIDSGTGTSGQAGVAAGNSSPMGTTGSSSGGGGSGFAGTGSGANGLAGTSSGVGAGSMATGSRVGSTSGATALNVPAPPASFVLLDGMGALESSTGSSWYTYSDRVLPNSAPPVIQANLPGVIIPTEGTTFAPYTGDPRSPEFQNSNGEWMTVPFREVTGHGNDVWGAGFGLDFTDMRPAQDDPIIASINACPSDAGISPLFDATNPAVSVPIPFNAQSHGYTGIGFYAISFSGLPVQVDVVLDDPRTNARGGICDVCLNGGRCGIAEDGGQDCPCDDSFVESVFLSTVWDLYTFHFTDPGLSTQNWSGQGLEPGSILSSALYNLHFQLSVQSGGSLPAFDIGVAYLFWLTD